MGPKAVQPLGPTASRVCAIVNPATTDPNGPANLMLVDARTPSAPVLYPFETQFGMASVAVANGYFLVADWNGLTVYKIQAAH